MITFTLKQFLFNCLRNMPFSNTACLTLISFLKLLRHLIIVRTEMTRESYKAESVTYPRGQKQVDHEIPLPQKENIQFRYVNCISY